MATPNSSCTAAAASTRLALASTELFPEDQSMLTSKTLSLTDAKRVAAAASAKATAEGWNVVIAVHDHGGHLIYLERADGTQLGSVVVAQEKSRTALMFKRPTKVLEDTILSGRVHMMSLPGITSVEGGLPL